MTRAFQYWKEFWISSVVLEPPEYCLDRSLFSNSSFNTPVIRTVIFRWADHYARKGLTDKNPTFMPLCASTLACALGRKSQTQWNARYIPTARFITLHGKSFTFFYWSLELHRIVDVYFLVILMTSGGLPSGRLLEELSIQWKSRLSNPLIPATNI